MSDVDKSVPIPKAIDSKRKWFGDDQKPRNKVLSFTGKWHGEEPQPPSLSSTDIVKINEMIADGKDPQIKLQQPKDEESKQEKQPSKRLDPLAVVLGALNMKKEGNRFVKKDEE